MDSSSSTDKSHHQREAPLCAGGCGFFGSAENEGLCSKCYKDYLKEKISTSESAILNPDLAPRADLNNIPLELEIGKLVETLKSLATAEIDGTNNSSVSATPIAKKNRCEVCRKKIGLVGFQCRCGGSFCGAHRYPEAHPCNFDFKTAGKTAIQKENPLCRADKIRDRV